MKKLKIKCIEFDKKLIEFKNGINYIIGSNGTGKTTLYNYIELGLGLQNKNYSSSRSDIYAKNISISLSIGEDDYRFSRNLNSSIVEIVSENNRMEYSINSKEYLEFLNKSFEPKFIFEHKKESIKMILEYHFYSGEMLSRIRNRMNNQYKLILGVDVGALDDYDIEIRELERKLKQEEESNKAVKTYKNRLISQIEKSGIDKNVVTNLIGMVDAEFFRTYNTLINQNEILKESREAFKKIQYELHHYEKIRMEEVLEKTNYNLQRFNFLLDSSEMTENSRKSGGEISIIEIVKRLTTMTLDSEFNTSSMLIADDIFSNLDNYAISLLNELLGELAEKNGLQVIIFSRNNKAINKNEIVYNLDSGGANKWIL
ncbi:ATP-binding protein [Fusibacter bizertensis]|uniref:ATP-binding protein n=1 Tax=Fusibacter bizertensis TaxID=1488331 RepID=A0ABT6NG04_9FIRM|nr:ATP-binding protein [Fusibacter bizertensis]MDH8679288.1 ATP-binding protein [Fusibacter bizertensis]